jgi:hypothetical protein
MKIGERFNPYKRFPGIHIPEPVCKYRGLSPGAKLVYGLNTTPRAGFNRTCRSLRPST